MNSKIKNVITKHLEKNAILYEHSLGAEEMWHFMAKAPLELQNLVFKMLNQGNVEEAIKIVEKTLGMEEGTLWKHIQ